MIAHSAVLIQQRVTDFQIANELLSQRRKRQKKRIQKQGAIAIALGQDIIAQCEANQQLQREMRENGTQKG